MKTLLSSFFIIFFYNATLYGKQTTRVQINKLTNIIVCFEQNNRIALFGNKEMWYDYQDTTINQRPNAEDVSNYSSLYVWPSITKHIDIVSTPIKTKCKTNQSRITTSRIFD